MKTRLRWFDHVKCRDENRLLRRVMELVTKGRRPVGRPKKTWKKTFMRKLNIIKKNNMAENRKQWRQLISRPTPGVGN